MTISLLPTNPDADGFAYFDSHWRLLWDYCCYIAPDIIDDECLQENGFYPNGAGLSDADAKLLGCRLEERIRQGEAAAFAEHLRLSQEALHAQECTQCKGSNKKDCLHCGGRRLVCHPFGVYAFDLGIAADFATFLRNCNGYEVPPVDC